MLATQIWHDQSTPTLQVLITVAATLLLVVTGGCDSVPFFDGEETPEFSIQVAHESIQSGSVNVDQIDRGQYGDIVEGTRKVFRDEEAYASFWERLHADRGSIPSRPEVDFNSRVVVAIVLGERPSGGYGVEIDEVLTSENGEEIQAQFTEVVPGDDCVVTGALTSPYILVAVEAKGGAFSFSRSTETRSC